MICLWFRVMLAFGIALTSACGDSDSKEIDVMAFDRPSASSLPPEKIDPLIIDGVVYAQYFGVESEDGQVGGLLGAYDAAGPLLWTLKIYENARQKNLEGDVQDVFFRSMALESDGRLRIVNENNDAFLVDIEARTVTALPKQKRANDRMIRRNPQSE